LSGRGLGERRGACRQRADEQHGGQHVDAAATSNYSMVRFLVIAIAVLMVFPYLQGAGTEVFGGVSVFLGPLEALGTAAAIAVVIAGNVIACLRPFRAGDRPR